MSTKNIALQKYDYVSPYEQWGSYDVAPPKGQRHSPSCLSLLTSAEYNLPLRILAVATTCLAKNTAIFLYNRKVGIQAIFTPNPTTSITPQKEPKPYIPTQEQIGISQIPNKVIPWGTSAAYMWLPLGKWIYNGIFSAPEAPIGPAKEAFSATSALSKALNFFETWDTKTVALTTLSGVLAFNVAAEFWAQRGENSTYTQRAKQAISKQLTPHPLLIGASVTALALLSPSYFPVLEQSAAKISHLLNTVTFGFWPTTSPTFSLSDNLLFKSAIALPMSFGLYNTYIHSPTLAKTIGVIYGTSAFLSVLETIQKKTYMEVTLSTAASRGLASICAIAFALSASVKPLPKIAPAG